MISEHSTHSTLAPENPCVSRRRATLPVGLINSTPLLVGFRTWLWQYTCLFLLISILWHRQVIFKSKGDKLSSSAGCRIRTHGVWNRSECPRTKRLNYQGSSKNLNSIARPYGQRAFSPLDPTAGWISYVTLPIYLFVVNFDALAQASDYRIEKRQVVFLWIQTHTQADTQL